MDLPLLFIYLYAKRCRRCPGNSMVSKKVRSLEMSAPDCSYGCLFRIQDLVASR
jgi:hypothetical protein